MYIYIFITNNVYIFKFNHETCLKQIKLNFFHVLLTCFRSLLMSSFLSTATVQIQKGQALSIILQLLLAVNLER